MSKFNYVVTANKPGGVSHAFTTSFTGADSSALNLVVARCDTFSVFTVSPDGLQKTVDVPVNGKIEFIRPLHFRGRTADSLLIITAKESLCILEYDVPSQSMVTKVAASLSSQSNRPPTELKGCLDTDCRVVVVWHQDGLLTVVPLDATGSYKDKTKYESYSLRLDELLIKDIKFLHGQEMPTLAVLYEDNKQKRHVKTYVINLKDKELVKGPWSQPNVESGASLLHSLPRACGGVLVFGDQSIAHLKGDLKESAVPLSMKPCIINCTAVIEESAECCKYLVGDTQGELKCLQVDISKSGSVSALRLEPLGEVSLPSCMAYVDDGVVFVGSMFGDSQLVKIAPERGADGGCLTMLSTEPNIGPIVDFCLVDSEQRGYSHFVSCSGAFKDSSLRIVKSGVGVEEQAAVDLEGIKGLWALKEGGADCMLVQSFVGETRVLKLSNDELQESDVPGFDMNSASLLCGNVSADVYFQVTASEVRLGGAAQAVWPCSFDRITSASADGANIVLLQRGACCQVTCIAGFRSISCFFEHHCSCPASF